MHGVYCSEATKKDIMVLFNSRPPNLCKIGKVAGNTSTSMLVRLKVTYLMVITSINFRVCVSFIFVHGHGGIL